MNVLIFNGSPKGRRGITYQLLSYFVEGITNAGASVEIIHLVEMNIKQCLGCWHCWNTEEGTCIQRDNMYELLEKMKKADLIVFESPLYFNNISSTLKIFLERCMPLSNRAFCIDSEGIYQHKCSYNIAPIVMFSTCGLPDIVNFDIVSLYGKLLSKHWNTSIVGEIYRSESFLFGTEMDNIEIILRDYIKRLRLAGEELVHNGCLSEQMTKKLNRSLIDKRFYIETGEEWFLT